jgi:hypothetical protein
MTRTSNATTMGTNEYKVSFQRSDYLGEIFMWGGGTKKLSSKDVERMHELERNFSIH